MMTPLEQLKQLRKLAQGKSDFIDNQLSIIVSLLDKLSEKLANKIAREFLNQLDINDGVIAVTLSNQNKVALIDKIYTEFMQKEGYKVIAAMVSDLKEINGLNEEYFTVLSGEKIDNKKILSVISNRLGINNDGSLKREGFMNGAMNNEFVRNEIRDFAMEKMVNGTGFDDMKQGLKDLIAGNKEKMGKFGQFYRNAAYDTYVKVDALNGKLYGDKLQLSCFVYAGTRRKASRHFCIKRKGKVFTREEAEQWKDLIGKTEIGENGKPVNAGPIVSNEDIPTYNPLVDRGGYGCVDDVMWIGDTVALHLRPDLKEYFEKKKAKT